MKSGACARWLRDVAACCTRCAQSRSVGWALAALATMDALNGVSHGPVRGQRLWIDLSPLPIPLQVTVLAVWAAWLARVLARRPPSTSRRKAAQWAIAVGAGVALARAAAFYADLFSGNISAGVPVPLSLLIAALLAGQAVALGRPDRGRRRLPVEVAGAGVMLVGLVLANILLLGGVSRRGRADVVVVFGARAYADGMPSLALHDRVRTACALYRLGLAKVMLVSGGPGDGPQTEPQVMARLARQWGVPDGAMVLDERGANTRLTVLNARDLMRQRGWRTATMVSHSYHLSRIDLCCRRAGIRCLTVPATQTRRLAREPFYLAREVAAWLVYSVRSIWDPLA